MDLFFAENAESVWIYSALSTALSNNFCQRNSVIQQIEIYMYMYLYDHQQFHFGNVSVISSPDDKNLYWSKLKAFTDILKVAQMTKFVIDSLENIVGKGENLVTSIFSFFHNVFKSLSLQGRLK